MVTEAFLEAVPFGVPVSPREARSYASTAMVERMVAWLRAHDHDADAIARDVGIDPTTLDERNELLPIHQAMAFYARAAEVSGEPFAAIEAAQQAEIRNYGIQGFAFANQPTLLEGFRDVGRIVEMLLPDLKWPVEVDEAAGVVVLSFNTHVPMRGYDGFCQDIVASYTLRGRDVTGVRWNPVSIDLTTPAPLDPDARAALEAKLEDLFGIVPTFGASSCRMVVRLEDAKRPVPGADPTLLTHLHEAVATQMKRRKTAMGQAKRVLRLADCLVDLDRGEIHRGKSRAHLTTKEREILAFMARRANEVVGHDELEKAVWGHGRHVVSHAPAVAVRRLRQKLEIDPSRPRNLLTVFGEGWTLRMGEGETATEATVG